VAKSVVAIPVRDEADRIGACLTALNAQTQPPDAVVLLLNNCTDRSEAIVREMAPWLRFRLGVVGRELAPAQANAGHARRLAMQYAAELVGAQGVLLTTDADSVVPPEWVLRNLQGLDKGADIVCGRAVIDPLEAALIPAHLHDDDARECRLIALLDMLAWMLDPEPHDPPPRHTEASGASLAVRVEAFRRVGGIPDIAAGEDRAFVRALWMMDARVRHDPAIQVIVSGRIVGRAEGGMADAMRRRVIRQDIFADDQAEPAEDAFRRYALRGRVRQVWQGARDPLLAGELGVSAERLRSCLALRYFGTVWAALEARSAVLRRRRVRFTDLPGEIAAAEALLRAATVPDVLAAD
jgi:GT2 family glycosyltransferase